MSYESEGYEVVSFLTKAQLEGFRLAIDSRLEAAVLEANVPAGSGFPGEPVESRLEHIARVDRALADKLLLSVYRSAHLDARIAFLDGYGKLRTFAEDFLRAPVRSFTIRVRANVPSLPGRRQNWHSDVSVLDGGEFSEVRIACWIPLMSVDAGNGALEVVPGKRAFPMAHEGDPDKHTIREADLEGHGKRVIDCALGTAVFLDAFVPHRAIPNLSNQVRWSVVTWMMA